MLCYQPHAGGRLSCVELLTPGSAGLTTGPGEVARWTPGESTPVDAAVSQLIGSPPLDKLGIVKELSQLIIGSICEIFQQLRRP